MTGLPVELADPVLAAAPSLGVVLQGGVDVNVTTNPLRNVVSSAVGAFLTTLVVGAIMIAVWPDYTQGKMQRVLDDPLGTFVYGLVVIVFLVVVTVVLAITIVGIVVAIPLMIASWVLWAVGSAIAFLAIADRIVGHEDGWTTPVLVAAGLNGLLTLTGIGGLVSFAVGAAGFGAVLRAYLE